MNIDIITIDKETPQNDFIYIKRTISLCADEESLTALRDIINLKLKLKNSVSSTLVLTSDYTGSTVLTVKLIGE